MAKSVTIGQMDRRIVIQSQTPGMDADGFPAPTWDEVFPEPIWCQWINAHGRELLETMRLEMREVATITMRYSEKVNERCRIWRAEDPKDTAHAFEILSIDNISDGRDLMEIKIKRVVVG